MRAGAHGLSLLSDPLDAKVLRLLENGPLTLIDLRQSAGLPPQSTLRKHLKALDELGILIRTQARDFPSAVTYELSIAGSELRAAAKSVEAWLETSPDASPVAQEGTTTKRTIKSLVDGWSTTMLRALVAKPLSLTELDRLLPGVDYPALERRLTAMRLAGLIETVRGSAANITPYRVTRWLREAAGPLILMADWEHRHSTIDGKPLDRLDMETIFLLAIPLVRLPKGSKGTCQLIVDFAEGERDVRAGVAVVVDEGRPVSCTSLGRSEGNAVASGSGSAWLSVLSGSRGASICFDGDRTLAQSFVAGLRHVCGSATSEDRLRAA